MEKNYISRFEETHFYIDLINHTYGVCANIKDADKLPELIAKAKKNRKEQINAWKQEWGVA